MSIQAHANRRLQSTWLPLSSLPQRNAKEADRFRAVPASMKQERRWVVWRYDKGPNPNKSTKVPYSISERRAKSNDPSTWACFSDVETLCAKDKGYSGVGFMLGDNWSAIDVDDCLDIDAGTISPLAAEIIARADSYTEVSPSQRGVRIVLRGALPPGRRKSGCVEMYDSGRMVTITGQHFSGTPSTVEERLSALASLHEQFFGRITQLETGDSGASEVRTEGSASGVSTEIDVETVREGLRELARGDVALKLFDGDTSAYHSQSEADLALCSFLRQAYDGDRGMIDAAFRASALYRAKWNEPHFADGLTYGEGTIKKALDGLFALSALSARHHPWRRPTARIAGAWPKLTDSALHGIAGDVVRAILPHTEADPAALLVTLLAGLGNAIGSSPHVRVGGAKHPPRLYVCVVGDTGRSRKGQSLQDTKPLLAQTDETWFNDALVSGLSTGEGLIGMLRDRDDLTVERPAFVVEPEFARILNVNSRDGNTLSAVLRDGWDGSPLQVLTRRDPLKASRANVAMVAHITREEFKCRSKDLDAYNGFLNRFLYVCARRSKLLPSGGNLSPAAISGLGARLRQIVKSARKVCAVRRTEAAEALWESIYASLPEDYGLLGAVTARADAQLLRLSLIYALLDNASAIDTQHIKAAKALWDYCYASAKYIFGSITTNGIAEKLLAALRRAYPAPLDGTQQRDVFSRHVGDVELDQARDELEEIGLAKTVLIQTGGRPKISTIAIVTDECAKSA